MTDLDKLNSDAMELTPSKYRLRGQGKKNSKTGDKISKFVFDATKVKEEILKMPDGEEKTKLAVKHDEIVDKVNDYWKKDDDRINKLKKGEFYVQPKLSKAGETEPNEVIKVSKSETGEVSEGKFSIPKGKDEPPSEPSMPSVPSMPSEPSEPDTHTMPDGTVMTGKEHTEESVEVEEAKEETKVEEEDEEVLATPRDEPPREDIPMEEEPREAEPREAPPMEEKEEERKSESIMDVPSFSIDIPEGRKGAEGKTARQLNSDIKYFLKNYPALLKSEAELYKKADKKNKQVLKDIHRRIIAILIPKEEKKTIGIILDAEKYLNEKINQILSMKTVEGLKPADLVEITEEPKKKGREVGSYAVVENRDGKPAAERLPVYRAIPTTNEMKPKSRISRINTASIKQNVGKRKVDIAKMEISNNPFAKEQKSNRFDIVL